MIMFNVGNFCLSIEAYKYNYFFKFTSFILCFSSQVNVIIHHVVKSKTYLYSVMDSVVAMYLDYSLIS